MLLYGNPIGLKKRLTMQTLEVLGDTAREYSKFLYIIYSLQRFSKCAKFLLFEQITHKLSSPISNPFSYVLLFFFFHYLLKNNIPSVCYCVVRSKHHIK